MVLDLFLHFASAQTSSIIEPQDFTTLYLKYFILSRNGHWCLSWKFTNPATFQDFTGHWYRVSLYHYFAAQLSNFNWGFTERWSCSLHSCSTHQSRTLQSTCSKLGSPEYFLLAWRRGQAQHTTMNNQNSWEVLCWATNLALKWELTNPLYQAKSMELLPAEQSPLYGTQINGFPIVHLSLPSIMRSWWLSRHSIVLVQSLNGWIKKNNN